MHVICGELYKGQCFHGYAYSTLVYVCVLCFEYILVLVNTYHIIQFINPLHPIVSKCAREILCPLHLIAAKCACTSLPLLIVITAGFGLGVSYYV